MNKVYFFLFYFPQLVLAQTWAVGKYENSQVETYANDLNLNRSLTISGAQALEVSVLGKTEAGYDFLTVYDGKKKKIRRLTGPINEKFTVKGATIYLNFYSDARAGGEGVLVKVASSTILNELKTRLLDATYQILKGGSGEVYQQVNIQLNELVKLTSAIKAQPIDNVLEQIVAQLGAITKIYKNIGMTRETIMSLHQTQLAIIAELTTEISHHLTKLKEETEKYSTLMTASQNQLKLNTLSTIARQKEQLAGEVYRKILVKMGNQQKSWEALDGYRSSLEKQLMEYSEQIGLLLYFFKVNAQLYEQATQVTMMRNSIADLNDLINLSQLQKMVDEITHKEQKIKEIINQVQINK